MSPILNLGFISSSSSLLCRMDKKSDFLIFFSIKTIEHFFSGIQVSDKFRRFVNMLVSITFHETLKYKFQG